MFSFLPLSFSSTLTPHPTPTPPSSWSAPPLDSGLSAHFLGGSPGSAGEERSCYVCSVMDGQEGQEFCSGIPAFTAESASHTTCV